MKKKFVYIGAILIVISIIILAVLIAYVSSLTSSSSENALGLKNFTVDENNIYSYPFYSNGNSSLLISIINNKADMMILNVSEFKNWESTNETIDSAINNKDAMLIINNITNLTIPLSPKIIPNYISTSNLKANLANGIIPIGYYDLVVYNKNGSPSSNSSIPGIIDYIPSSKLGFISGYLDKMSIAAIVMILLFVAGLIIIIYGFIKKDDQEKAMMNKKDETSNYIDNLYDSVEDSSDKQVKSNKRSKNKVIKKAKDKKKNQVNDQSKK